MLIIDQTIDGYNDMTAPRQISFLEFAGPGIDFPSDAMRVTDREAKDILAALAVQSWTPPQAVKSLADSGYSIRHASDTYDTALFGPDGMVGFYAGSYLWIAPEHRGKGLSIPLIVAAAEQRGGCIMPPGVVLQGYTPAGLAAHRKAHQLAMQDIGGELSRERARTPGAADCVQLRLAGAIR